MSTTSPVTSLLAAASAPSFAFSSAANASGAKAIATVKLIATAAVKTLGLFAVELNMFHFPPFLAFNQLGKLREEIGRVMRAGRGLGMILHAEDRQLAMSHSFDGVVVQIDVGDLDFFRQ